MVDYRWTVFWQHCSGSSLLNRIAVGGLFIIFTGALVVHLPDGWAMNWFGEKKGEGIEYHVMLLALLLIVIVRGSGSHVNRSLANILERNEQSASRGEGRGVQGDSYSIPAVGQVPAPSSDHSLYFI